MNDVHVPSLPRPRRNLSSDHLAKVVCIHAVHINKPKERNSVKNLEIRRRDNYLLRPQQLSLGDTGKVAGSGKTGWIGRRRRGGGLAAAVLWKDEA